MVKKMKKFIKINGNNNFLINHKKNNIEPSSEALWMFF